MDLSTDGKGKGRYSRVVSSVMPFFRFKRTLQCPHSPDICPCDRFLFGWLKEKLQQPQFTDPVELFRPSMKSSPHSRLI
jgi:hypothetical protein